MGVQAFIFDLGWGELVVIGVVALIVFGPKELPTVLRTAGQWMGKIRRMAAEFQGQFQEAMREAEVAHLKEQFDSIQEVAKEIRSFDPAGTAITQIESAAGEPQSSAAAKTADTSGTPQAAASTQHAASAAGAVVSDGEAPVSGRSQGDPGKAQAESRSS
jgi:sec-independent protein translocase protein TatB